jgi:hypothetical protein
LFSLGAFSVLAQGHPAVTYDTLVLVELPKPAYSGLWPKLKSEVDRSKTPKLLGGSVLTMKREEFREDMEF